jgi:hypothetical protein
MVTLMDGKSSRYSCGDMLSHLNHAIPLPFQFRQEEPRAQNSSGIVTSAITAWELSTGTLELVVAVWLSRLFEYTM